jgi:hypothetical protein
VNFTHFNGDNAASSRLLERRIAQKCCNNRSDANDEMAIPAKNRLENKIEKVSLFHPQSFFCLFFFFFLFTSLHGTPY